MASAPAKNRRPGFRLLAVALAVGFAVVCFEVVLRVVDIGGYAVLEDKERFTAEILERDERGWLRLKASATSSYLGHEVRTSAQRLRNRDVVVPKPAGVYRVLVVGDSVPFGWGVAEDRSFPRLLEAALQQSPRRDGRTWEVVNGGSPGWGIVEQFTWLEQVGVTFQPDIVLHSIINNDIDPHPKPPPLFLTDGLRHVRTLRLLETIVGRVAGDPGVEPGTGLSPELVVMAIERFRGLCAGKGCGYAVIDAYERVQGAGKPEQRFPLAAVEHMAKVGVPLLDLGLTREWVHAHQVAKNDYHPGAAGHAEITAKLLPMVRALAEK